ncbi:hypothetical protein KUCAC02_015758 [Chaenocephalus aceratus]|uniref:Uncharacterized protein n=1 Tax=Chaenocephalus aceratus TaxID=36190 RepID=A0ACB9Y010_CHAAC|nr:hypothetical protein KUCAC02_015758 [Chaenocephalus aceratus]
MPVNGQVMVAACTGPQTTAVKLSIHRTDSEEEGAKPPRPQTCAAALCDTEGESACDGGDSRQSRSDTAPSDAKRRCCITLSPATDETPCNEFISQITVFRL